MSFDTFVTTTRLEDVNPLSPGGQPLYRSHDVLERELAARLSPAHAAVFAEPEIGAASDRVDWYGPGRDFRRLGALDEPEQTETRRRVATLFDDISGLSERLSSSADDDERYLSRLLSHALRLPSEDSIHVGTEGPLFTDWGSVARGAPTEYHVLRNLRDRTVEADAGAGTEGTGGPESIPPALFVGSIVATMILIPLILALLLGACAVALPSFGSGSTGRPILSYCEGNTRADSLLNLISGYEREIARKQKTCTGDTDTAGATPGEPGPTRPAEPAPPAIQGTIRLSAVSPPVGKLCAIAICASGLSTDPEDPDCAKSNDWKAGIVPQVPEDYCRAFVFPIEFSVEPGTSFTARYKVLADGEPYRGYDVEAETFPQQLLDVLERNGHPRLYWVSDFLWPPEDADPDTKDTD